MASLPQSQTGNKGRGNVNAMTCFCFMFIIHSSTQHSTVTFDFCNSAFKCFMWFREVRRMLRAGTLLTCVVRMQEGRLMAPRRRQLTLRRIEGSTGVSRKYRPRAMSMPRSTPGNHYTWSKRSTFQTSPHPRPPPKESLKWRGSVHWL